MGGQTVKNDPAKVRDRTGTTKEKKGAAKQKTANPKKQDKRFPAGSLVLSLLLLIVIFAGLYEGMIYRDRYNALRDYYEAAFEQADAELSAAKAEFDEADPESAAHKAERSELTEKMMAEANTELEKINGDIGKTDEAIADAEARIKEYESVEGFDYYKAIYDEYKEGGAYVEDLLSGN